LSPRLVFMLVVTELVQLMEVVDVMDELCQLPSC